MRSVASSLRVHRQRTLAIVAVALLGLLAGGCVFTTTVYTPVRHRLSGAVGLGRFGLRMDYVTVCYSGPRSGCADTGADGSFSISNLPGGVYELTAQTTLGHYPIKPSLSLYGDRYEFIEIPYPYRAGSSEETAFLDLSGLREVYAYGDNPGEVTRRVGRSVRWRRGATIPVYINERSAPSADWPRWVKDYIRSEVKSLDGQVQVTFVAYNPVQKGIGIHWTPPNGVPGGVAGQVTLLDDYGYLYYAMVLVDERFGDITTSRVMAHEIWHCMGANHRNNLSSLMYPFEVYGSQGWVLSGEERDQFVKYAYAIAPNQSVSYGTMGVMQAQDARAEQIVGAPRVVTEIRRADGTTEVTEGIPDELKKLEVVQELLDSLGTQGTSGFLWDQIDAGTDSR